MRREKEKMNAHEMSNDELLAHALRMWANYVETKDPLFSAQDFAERGKALIPLSRDGMRLSTRLRDLADQVESEGRVDQGRVWNE